MSEFTRRSFIGKTAIAIGSFAALQKVVNAANRLIRVQPIGCSMARARIRCGHPGRTPRAWCKISTTRFLCEQACLRRRMVARSDGSGAPRVQDLGRCEHEAQRRWIRELHWHTASEWAIMLYGSARLTAIDLDGKSFVADVNKNDLWFFPPGIPHSIQGLNPDGCEFMLVFDDGNFSESETVLLSDAMGHLPPECWQKISLSANRRRRTSRNKNYLFFKLIYQVHWKPTRRQRPGRAESRHRTLCFARWKCRRRRKRRWRGARC